MKYYYDIELSFDESPRQYYDWEDYERLMRIEVLKIRNLSIIIEYHTTIDLADGKYILCDNYNAIGIEVINKEIAYLSYLKYDDENYVIRLGDNMDYSDIQITTKEKRNLNNDLKEESKIKKVLISLIKEANDNLLKYIYYDITDTYCDNIKRIKSFLLTDINNNFNQKYIKLYENIYQ